MPAGRPPKYHTPEDMQKDIDAYFEECEDESKHMTISGLAYALDMTTQALRGYEDKDEFLSTVKKAKQFVEMYVEQILMSGNATAGTIFWLKNNAGWKDKTETSNTHDVKVTKIERTIIDS
jgi:hypothetical protein